MRVSDFDFDLPPELIAQTPTDDRESARLLLVDRESHGFEDRRVTDLPDLLGPRDLLVINDTRVFPARLLGHRVPTGGAVECLLLTRLDGERWDALMHPGQKLRVGARVRFEREGRQLHGEVLEHRVFGRRTIRLWVDGDGTVDELVDELGHIPLPPYIRRSDRPVDRDRYQTVYAAVRGSVAAPTAGLHLTDAMLQRCAERGIEVARLTLHVGYGTFKPVRVDRVEDHTVDAESYDVPPETADAVNRALDTGRRVVSVGTTTTRALETAARAGGGRLRAGRGVSDLYLYPGVPVQVVGALFTNFHLPRSSLLMLVSALGGRERVLDAYAAAVRRGYRFYSYGDAMLLL
ncbi:MAG TPA: tRNA preQ1(34) S-adenosylmethionine ribosyltransferase-isomerase QueA [Acidobacteria bacterium]|nr:tRNA preQ1(34) S-adenosylmethionine ribosyltransferase-isomerase QueA [Acidobacteriota bacterium]MEE2964693.1 tRNA preQ1(34) S-adenosylmethionine ribosyltransferase-isomerase QueA [Acidobacteriota bacterium]HCE03099.1 tRNA preQ1(34) S-adenosylmethionine ribosyltransferase-isomerase QueA [Acidobacteriota bacterium]